MADAKEPSSTGGPEFGDASGPLSSNESFECCVCLDLIFKPVVLVCGHISCFWCVHRAMDGIMESHCPLCRRPYKYFPAICQVLHNLLRKIDPVDYKRREKEVLEIESEQNCFSPQFVDHVTEGTLYICTLVEQSASNVTDALQENDSVEKENSKIEIEHFNVGGSDNDGHIAFKDGRLPESLKNESSQDLCVSDALCAGCTQLLFQPVVLNCGHVYCKPCFLSLGSEAPRCQVCQSIHPGDLPKLCLQLNNFLEKKFPEEYAKRRQLFQDLPSCGCEANKHDVKADEHKRALSTEDMLKTHVQVGCDSCGMYPIVGKRYKCKDCTELIGFDLCETCYSTRSKLPARFNQQHTPDHTFVLDETMTLARIYRGALTHEFDDDLIR